MTKIKLTDINPETDYVIARDKLDYIFERLNEADSILFKLVEGKAEAIMEARLYLWSASRLYSTDELD